MAKPSINANGNGTSVAQETEVKDPQRRKLILLAQTSSTRLAGSIVDFVLSEVVVPAYSDKILHLSRPANG